MNFGESDLEIALNPPRRSAQFEGVGGVLKHENSDFFVEEIPAYEACGEGNFLYVSLEKRGLSHGRLVQHLCSSLGVKERDLGWAGMKDTHAHTRQVISLPIECADRVESLEREDCSVLWSKAHTNRLKRGHLHGNFFRVRVRDVCPDALVRSRKIADFLSPVGVPNYFGVQRFGRGGGNVEEGLSLLNSLAEGRRLKKGFRTEIRVNAVQSWLFNRLVARRMSEDSFDRALQGDVLKKRETGGMFTAEDPAVESHRVQKGEISITGPIYGRKMWWPDDEAKLLEEDVLEESGLAMEIFERAGKVLRGTRRPIHLWPTDVSIEAEDEDLLFSFTLPSGAYATVFLREFMGEAVA
jgi:tRNA pseudouridine13 synthase